MITKLRELYSYRELLFMIIIRDIKVRYKQSLMGFFWAVLMPMLIVLAGIMVRYAYAVASHNPFSTTDFATIAIRSVPWAFLVSSIRFSCQSLTGGNQNLVTKVYFPKEILPIASVLSQLFDLFIASIVLLLLMIATKTGLNFQTVWFVPLLGILILLALGIGLLVSAGNLFFRDVRYIVEIFLTFAIFFTPVFYDVSMFGEQGRWLLLNPVAPLMEGFSSIVRGQTPNWWWAAYSLAFGALLGVLAYSLFKKLEPAFAESI